jgi:hypothetical protein
MKVSDQLHAPAALTPGKKPRYLLDRRLGGLQSRSGRGGEDKNSQPRRESNSRTPIIQPTISLSLMKERKNKRTETAESVCGS